MLTIGVPAAIVVAGWFFGHWLTARRELSSRKREARLKALEAAYMRLATSSNRELTPELLDKLETFVSEIQLYGTPKQVELMSQLVQAFIRPPGVVSFDELLRDLRDTIREQLALEPLQGPVWWLRLPRPVLAPTVASVTADQQSTLQPKSGDGVSHKA